jgi:cytochrome c
MYGDGLLQDTLGGAMYRKRADRRCFLNRASVSGFALVVALGLGVLASAQAPAKPQSVQSPSGLGRAPSEAEVRAWDIAVAPDGAGLPSGSGSAAQGALVFTQRDCSTCHGSTGKEGPAPVLVGGTASNSTSFFPIVYWPFAPKILDFVRRAMPYDRPGRLTPDELYSVTAFLLYRNGIIQEDDVMDAKSLPKVQMPHRDRYKVPAPRTADSRRGFKIVP